MRYTACAAMVALGVSTASAFALDSSVTMTSSLSTEALWKKVGDFCGIATWHPAIEKCVLSADGKQRTLSVKGGGTVVEALEKWDDAKHSYSYTILSGPLPVANYHSTISVGADPKGSTLNWMGKYDAAKGVPDADAKKTMDGIYEAGVKSLTGS
jgi:Polyketide cyclase / dehydrase and lipid transport